jgi:hypothetical protein
MTVTLTKPERQVLRQMQIHCAEIVLTASGEWWLGGHWFEEGIGQGLLRKGMITEMPNAFPSTHRFSISSNGRAVLGEIGTGSQLFPRF